MSLLHKDINIHLTLKKQTEKAKKKVADTIGNLLIFLKKYSLYARKLNKIPAATAEPITPATFGPMACISKWFVLSYSKPTT